MFIHEDHQFCNAINARLERLYYLDGRDNPDHKHHHTYTGLALKVRGVPSLPEAKTFQLEDGSIRIEVGEFWKVVSSWHLAGSWLKTSSSKPGVHHYR